MVPSTSRLTALFTGVPVRTISERLVFRSSTMRAPVSRLVDEMIPKETASEKSAAEGWKARGKRLLNWVNAKEEEEQQ